MNTPARYVAGIHSVRAALKHGDGQVERVWFDARRNDRRLGQLLSVVRKQNIELLATDKAELGRLAQGSQHQGIVAQVRMAAAQNEDALDALLQQLQEPPFLLVLDGVQDPHNLGACLRTADAAGIHAVIAPRDRAVGLTPVACKVASGAAESVPFIQVTNLARTLRQLRNACNLWVVGLAGESDQSLYQTDLKGPLVVVMGGEEKGIRRLVREQCDVLVSLPMKGVVESLNVSVATGISLFEAVRQRNS
ncbi:23S rRNA (guanosine(2251)-2'-O)-methyltransferase RlmB [Thiolapillus brandeum]|uniref:23S rRNA (guanosine-2'-O-)-methyltransferase RlmB n=1 Tax=Thiolapillus brandeum TaxID=1076588 RepID=A0A7U6GJG8_9GAMM|nr:23S rRNA (guanosine(2251)-2'-O)-methyltransferase RlmB [Thiolapillus brandeum]BAO44728.1 RNA methyltransferase TrmH family [Thiolapillus brandeum]